MRKYLNYLHALSYMIEIGLLKFHTVKILTEVNAKNSDLACNSSVKIVTHIPNFFQQHREQPSEDHPLGNRNRRVEFEQYHVGVEDQKRKIHKLSQSVQKQKLAILFKFFTHDQRTVLYAQHIIVQKSELCSTA